MEKYEAHLKQGAAMLPLCKAGSNQVIEVKGGLAEYSMEPRGMGPSPTTYVNYLTEFLEQSKCLINESYFYSQTQFL